MGESPGTPPDEERLRMAVGKALAYAGIEGGDEDEAIL